jgi:hypothetical protein
MAKLGTGMGKRFSRALISVYTNVRGNAQKKNGSWDWFREWALT